MTQIKLIFSVFGDLLDHRSFSKLSGIEPTAFWDKGDVVPNRKKILRQETCWEYSTGYIGTLDVQILCVNFFQKFKPNAEEIISYIGQNDLETKFDIVVEIKNNQIPSLSFNVEFLELVAKLNGSLDIDLYVLDENS